MSIGGLRVTSGLVKFTDRSIKPPFALSLAKIDVATGRLSTDSIGGDTLHMTAAIDDVAPLRVTGRFNPLSDKEGIDLAIEMQSMDMVPLSPYFGKHVGNGIAAGQLSLAIKFRVAGRRLTSHSKITMHDLEWGEATDSPDATKLPVKTAFRVMRDRSGRIVLEIPVEGNLDDPSFRVEQVVAQQFKDLILRIATSPFALLGISGGGGETDISTIHFAAGSHALSDAERRKLDLLAKEMYDHPDLKVQIAGSVDTVADRAFEGELQALAAARAKACLDHLLAAPNYKIEADRVIIAGGAMKTEGAKAVFTTQ